MASKKIVIKLNVHDDKGKKRSMKAVSSIRGIDSISMDMKEGKLTITGDVDPVDIIYKLRKIVEAQIVSVGPAKEPEKEKKDDEKAEPEKKDDNKEKQKKEEEKLKEMNDQVCELVRAYREYNPYMTKIYVVHSIEEDPNACVIC